VELRPAVDDDLPALHRLFVRAVAGIFEPHGFQPPAPRLEAFANQHRHVLASGTTLIAEARGRELGFGSAWERDGHWFLGSLFVDPPAHGRGIGSALLDALWGRAAHRRTITDAIQPVSNALYARRGLIPATPILSFSGRPSPRASSSRAEPVFRPDAVDLAEVDSAAYGFDRSVDHAYWARHATRTTWPGAYSYAFPSGEIGPVAGLDEASAARALAAELARAEGEVRVRVPGSSRALVEVALDAGLRLGPVPGFLLLSAGLQPPSRLAIAGYLLY
jgi:GNAT superfamily N-acetyltransferase